jgi:uncharacterized protein
MMWTQLDIRSWQGLRLGGARSHVVAWLIVLILLAPGRAVLAVPSDDLLNSLQAHADVSDFAGILTPEQKNALEDLCRDLRAKTGAQLAVVVLKSLQGGQIDDFAERLFKKWGIGQADKRNGVLLLVALDDHKARIETGYGLEGVLPDILGGQILREQLFPAFKQQQYYAGLSAAVARIVEIIEKNEPAPAMNAQPQGQFPWEAAIILCLFLTVWVSPPSYGAGMMLRARQAGAAVAQGFWALVAIVIPLFLQTPVFVPAVVSVAALLCGLLGFFASPGTWGRGRSRSRWDSGWGNWNWDPGPYSGGSTSWGGGGFSGGGGGSWGGFGGGSSGGGGASGSW